MQTDAKRRKEAACRALAELDYLLMRHVGHRGQSAPDRPVSVSPQDFAQVFGVYPREKYRKASYRNIAEVLAFETSGEDIAEFIRRLVFNTLIGNADMHLKNWSLIYRDRRNAALAPAYDLVSTIAYIMDDNAGLKYARTKRVHEFTEEELVYLAAKARLPEKLVVDTARGNRVSLS